jgi:hypothetical protein
MRGANEKLELLLLPPEPEKELEEDPNPADPPNKILPLGTWAFATRKAHKEATRKVTIFFIK